MGLTLVLVTAAYLCGGLPIGVWLARLAGVDLQRSGSGNIGATNVARTAGWRLGMLTLLGDAAKGFVPVVIAQSLVDDAWSVAAVGMAAFCGHLFSFLLRFRGGKGVATALGVFVAAAPLAVAGSAAVFALVVLTSRYVSLASILGAASLPIMTLLCGSSRPIQTLAFTVAVAIVYRHHDNIRRLMEGREPRFRSYN